MLVMSAAQPGEVPSCASNGLSNSDAGVHVSARSSVIAYVPGDVSPICIAHSCVPRLSSSTTALSEPALVT